MIDLEPINIICHNRRDPSSYLSVMEILNMYDLDGLNYKIWSHGTSFDKGRSINYTMSDYKLNSGNLFRLDILVWELLSSIHPSSIEESVQTLREYFKGIIIFVGDYPRDYDNPIYQFQNYPIYYLQKIEREFGFIDRIRALSNRDLTKKNLEEYTIEDREGNIQTISSWKTTFIRDRKLKNILDETKGKNPGDYLYIKYFNSIFDYI